MDIFRRKLAPITEKAWAEIFDQARETLKPNLTARRFVDVDGPKGLDFSAVPLGLLDVPKNQKEDVKYGINKVLPLVETRIPFTLNIWELDNLSRGADDVDLGNLEEAAEKIAAFEDKAIYYGFEAAGIKGLKDNSEYEVMSCPSSSEEAICGIPEGVAKLKEKAVAGPYVLVVNTKKWQEISTYHNGYPIRKQLRELLVDEIVMSHNIDGMFLVSKRGGDYKLTIGQDLTIGYESHTTKEVKLYLSESFTFQIFEPKAVVVYK